MTERLYQPGKVDAPASDGTLPVPPIELIDHPSAYLASERLARAVNVALLLGQPLLVTGEPGTGKTRLAYSVAWQLGLEPVLPFETKSTSTARDLFYTYDAIGRFNARKVDETAEITAADFIEFRALGQAIILANDPAGLEGIVPPWKLHAEARRSVVLIDEIDKAPRDFPNDILTEIEKMQFRIPELSAEKKKDIVIEADREMRPVVIITSNSEQNLPEAFLRRCIYFDIPFPTDDLPHIVAARMPELGGGPWVSDGMSLLEGLRDKSRGWDKPPSTAEFLAWLVALRRLNADVGRSLRQQRDKVDAALSALIKSTNDVERANEVINQWATAPR